jgi:hypothetical protein
MKGQSNKIQTTVREHFHIVLNIFDKSRPKKLFPLRFWFFKENQNFTNMPFTQSMFVK